MNKFIPVAQPLLNGNEKAYVLDCIESNWISSSGKYISAFEEAFAEYCTVRHALSCCNGTVALHLALLALDIGIGDEVIVPTLTYVASANAVCYVGATPVFVDSEPYSWNMDTSLLETLITPRTKAIMVVHLYGQPVDMDPVVDIAKRHNLYVIEDAAEAHGAQYKDRRVGSMGDVATFSFYGNKVITTGEGGMVTTHNDTLAERIRLLRGQGQDPVKRYWFPVVGYNYRMTNIAAAIGLAQLEQIDWHLERRKEIASWYRDRLRDHRYIRLQTEYDWSDNINWLFSLVLISEISFHRDALRERMLEANIETRPFFYPMHTLPMYHNSTNSRKYPVAERLSAGGINLPTWSGLSKEEVDYICNVLLEILDEL